MILLDILFDIFVVVGFVVLVVFNAKSKKYQKLWDKKKAMMIRMDPAITRAELCELYVEFCEKNDCWVDY